MWCYLVNDCKNLICKIEKLPNCKIFFGKINLCMLKNKNHWLIFVVELLKNEWCLPFLSLPLSLSFLIVFVYLYFCLFPVLSSSFFSSLYSSLLFINLLLVSLYSYLHAKQIIHRDLKSNSILFLTNTHTHKYTQYVCRRSVH